MNLIATSKNGEIPVFYFFPLAVVVVAGKFSTRIVDFQTNEVVAPAGIIT